MADRKISDLTALTTPASGDYLPIVDISEASAANKNKRITIEELLRGAPDGTAAAPGIAFESDGGNGFYLAGTDTIGASTNGVNRLTLSTSALTSTVPISATSFTPTSSTVPTNGVYLPAANSVAISTNGTGRLFVAADGKVGIAGTPFNPLDVFGSAALGIRYQSSGNYAGIIADNASSTGGGYFGAYKNGSQKAMFGVTGAFIGDTSGDCGVLAETGQAIRFFTNGSVTEKARIDGSGRLLVGTSSDSGGALLQVNDNRIRIATAKTPASAGDTGTTGEVCWDASYIYVCTATNTWKRAALSTW